MAIGAGIRRSIGSNYNGMERVTVFDHLFSANMVCSSLPYETSITLQIHCDHSTSHATDSTIADVFGLLGNIIDLSPVEFRRVSDYQHEYSRQDWKVLFARKLGK